MVCPGEISTPLLDYERAHGSRITETVNAFAGVLPVDKAVAGILKGIRKRECKVKPPDLAQGIPSPALTGVPAGMPHTRL